MYSQTITKMNEMKLHGMCKSFQERRAKADHQDLSHDEFTALLIDDEYLQRQNNRQRRLLAMARLRACNEISVWRISITSLTGVSSNLKLLTCKIRSGYRNIKTF